MATTYSSNPVTIPPTFLLSTPTDAKTITAQKIDFAKAKLPEYATRYATVLDHVLSPSECTTLVQLAEASVRAEDKQANGGSPWHPALLNAGTRNGQGFEAYVPSVRNNDRIIWDSPEIAERLWGRIEGVLGEELAVYRNGRGPNSTVWDFHSVNERMRFLRYGPGQYFRGHCDGAYRPPVGQQDGTVLSTMYTIHVYLNDSKKGADPDRPAAELEGGATSFLSELDDVAKLDIDPKAGRVLIFQHTFLFHCGAEVTAGTKYTLRTDIMYKLRQRDR